MPLEMPEGAALRLRILELFVPQVGAEAVRCAAEAYAFVLGGETSEQAGEGAQASLQVKEDPLPERTLPEDQLVLLERLWAAGKPTDEIASHLDVSDGMEVRRIARRTGVAGRWPRGSGGASLRPPYPLEARWPPPPIEEAQTLAEYKHAQNQRTSEATKAGLARAKARGVMLGNRPVWNDEVRKRAAELAAGGARTVEAICKKLKISEATFHKYTTIKAIRREAVGILAHQGFTFETIARKLRFKTWQEVREIAIAAGACAKNADGKWVSIRNELAVTMPSRQPKSRKCLRCGKGFLSEGPQHRMCDRCRGAVAGEYDPEST